MNADLTDMSLEDLIELQDGLATAVRRRLANAAEPEEAIPEVIRVGIHRYSANLAKVSPRNKRDTVLSDYRRCALGISLGSPSSEGAKLDACIRWIAENFDECALLVGDSIYHYTLQVTRDVTPEEGREQALQVGRDFVAQYDRMLDPYREQCRFEWYPLSKVMEKDRFHDYLADFWKLYEDGGAYRGLVDEFGTKYLGRLLEQQESISEEAVAFKEGCIRRYLVEETAAFTALCEEGWEVLVYPGAIKTFEEVAEGRLPEIPEPLKKLVYLSIQLNRGGLYFADSFGHAYAAAAPDDDVVGQGVLADLSESDWKRFMKYTARKRCLSGDVLIRTGDTDRNLYILLDGAVEILHGDWNASGNLQQVARCGPGSVLGDQSFIDGCARSATVAALGDSEVLVIPQKQFKRMRKKDPDLAVALLVDISRVLSLRLRGAIA